LKAEGEVADLADGRKRDVQQWKQHRWHDDRINLLVHIECCSDWEEAEQHEDLTLPEGELKCSQR